MDEQVVRLCLYIGFGLLLANSLVVLCRPTVLGGSTPDPEVRRLMYGTLLMTLSSFSVTFVSGLHVPLTPLIWAFHAVALAVSATGLYLAVVALIRVRSGNRNNPKPS